MKNFNFGVLLTVSLLTAGISTAQAKRVTGDVTKHYKEVITQNPYTVEVCKKVAVSGDKTKDTIIGAIIGGAIGNNVTKNVDNGGAIGAIIGGMVGNNNSNAQGGTKTQCQVETRYNEESKTVYSHSTIEFRIDGYIHRLRFN
jgi:uncharacterized protein YcfJ|tara:strand:- start:244 stop:672 length:429 start_codon:yes stop_codon:yes gene_type:complete